MFDYSLVIDLVGKGIDFFGVMLIVGGAVYSLLTFFNTVFLPKHKGAYQSLRDNLGRTILVGLEFLIAGDIIRSIAVPPTLQSVSVLAVIVVIRSFLSIELEHEISGRWPWTKK
jgi:uncharacterized membrane protein